MRQPNWKKWEVVLLVNMYFSLEGHPERVRTACEDLSAQLRRSNLDLALQSPSYRNVEGIRMKYQNIRHIVEGKGLADHSRLGEEIVRLYFEDRDSFDAEVKRILECK